MSDQLAFFTEPRARHDDPETSHVAAAKVKRGAPGLLARAQEIVDLAGPRGATSDEVWLRFVDDDPYWQTRQGSIRKRVSELAQEGRIVPAGPKRKRLSLTNTPQIIYVTPRWLT